MARTKQEESAPEMSDSTEVEFEEIQSGADAIQAIPYTFTLIGDAISGTYIRSRKVESEFRAQIAYDLRLESDGRVFCVYGNSDLNAKMQRVRTGSFVIIEYVSDEPIEGKPDYNPRKLYSVKVAKGKGTTGQGQTVASAPRKMK